MGEFQTKVEQFKQTIKEPGFTTDEVGTIDNEPTIGGISSDNNIDSHEVSSPDNNDKQTRVRKKHTNTFKKRIDQLTYESRIKDAQNHELMARLRNQEQLLIEKQNLLEQNENHKNAYYENNLSTREASIINELKAAKEDGDVEKEVALSKALAQVTAEQSTYNLYKTQIRPRDTYSSYNNENIENNYYPQPQISQPVDYGIHENEALESWFDNNPWADPNSSQFSPRLRSEVDDIANELDETLKYNGYGDMIGTPEYFSSLDNLMSDRYSVGRLQDTDEPQRQSQYSNQSTVAPVSRRGSSMADQYISSNPNSTRRAMSLTEDEYKIARNLQIKMPNGRYATGDEAVKRYVAAKRMNPGQGGSNKLVID